MTAPIIDLSSEVWERTPPKWDVIGLGENSVDFVYQVPGWPGSKGTGAKLAISERTVHCGGQVATTLATCAALGLRTSYIGAFGNDENAARIRDALARRGVDLSSAITRPAPNRYAVILVDARGERVVLWHRDPLLTLSAQDVPDVVSDARWLHVDATDEEAALWAADSASFSGMYVSCDIDRVTKRTRELIRHVDVPIFAEHVPQALTREKDPAKALKKLQRKRHVALCVTLGARGAVMLHKERVYRAPAFTVKATDTTGAGDIFRGALIYAMLRGGPPAEILRFANAAAALSCTRPGAMDSVPTLNQVDKLLLTTKATKVPTHTRP